MGTTKTTIFTKRQNRMASIAKALGHPARIAIIEVLIKRNNCICGDIVDELPLSQATISQHLKELKEVGLIKGDIAGRKTCYCINDQVWKEAEGVLTNMFGEYTCDSNCC